MSEKMSVAKEIEMRLREGLAPHLVEVVDDSESHRGHSGFQPHASIIQNPSDAKWSRTSSLRAPGHGRLRVGLRPHNFCSLDDAR